MSLQSPRPPQPSASCPSARKLVVAVVKKSPWTWAGPWRWLVVSRKLFNTLTTPPPTHPRPRPRPHFVFFSLSPSLLACLLAAIPPPPPPSPGPLAAPVHQTTTTAAASSARPLPASTPGCTHDALNYPTVTPLHAQAIFAIICHVHHDRLAAYNTPAAPATRPPQAVHQHRAASHPRKGRQPPSRHSQCRLAYCSQHLHKRLRAPIHGPHAAAPTTTLAVH